MKNIAEFDDAIQAVKPKLGQSAIEDLQNIRKVVQDNEVGDFQLLVSRDGSRVFIDDPSSFTSLPGGQRNSIELVDELLEAARNNMVKRQIFHNYQLPSESVDMLMNTCIGVKIKSIATGLPTNSLLEFKEKESLSDTDDIFLVPHGRPFFLALETGKTLTFNYDEFLNSIVLRLIDKSCFDDHFLKYLYSEDTYIREITKAKLIVESPKYSGYKNSTIDKITLLKYPNNYKLKPIGYDLINEIGLCFACSEGKEFIVMTGLGKKYKTSGTAILTWHDIDDAALEGIEKTLLVKTF